MIGNNFKSKIDNASIIFQDALKLLQHKEKLSAELLDKVSNDEYCRNNAAYLLYTASFYGDKDFLRNIIDKNNISQYLKTIIDDQTIADQYKAELIDNILALENDDINKQLVLSQNFFLTQTVKNNLPFTLNKLAALYADKNQKMTLDYKSALEISISSKFPDLVWVLCKYDKDGAYYAKQYAKNLAEAGDLLGVIAFCQQGWFVKGNSKYSEEINNYLEEIRKFDQQARLIIQKHPDNKINSLFLLAEIEQTNDSLKGKLVRNKTLVDAVTKQLDLYKNSVEEVERQSYLRKIISRLKVYIFGDRVIEFSSKVIAAHLASPDIYNYEEIYKEKFIKQDLDTASLFFNLKEDILKNNITSFKDNMSKILRLHNLNTETKELLSSIAFREVGKFLAYNGKESIDIAYLEPLKEIYKNNLQNAYDDILSITNNSANKYSDVAITKIMDLLEDSSKKNILKDGKILANIVQKIDNKELVKSVLSLHKQFGIKVNNSLLSESFHNGKLKNFSALLSSGMHCSNKLKQEVLKSNNEQFILKLASKGIVTVKEIKKDNPELAEKISKEVIDKGEFSEKALSQLSKKEEKISAKKQKISDNKIYRLIDFFRGNTTKLDNRLKAKSLVLKQDNNKSR